VMEYPNERLAYDKVLTDMKEMFETRNGNGAHNKEQKKLKSLSDGVTARTNVMVQQNKMEARFLSCMQIFVCLTFIVISFFFIRKQNTNHCHKRLLKNLEREILWSVTTINWFFVASFFKLRPPLFS